MSKKPRRFDLSVTQIVASVLASVSAATAASKLGVAGTIVGAAVVSAVATTASAVYGHSLRETNARLRRTVARQQAEAVDDFQADARSGVPELAGEVSEPRSRDDAPTLRVAKVTASVDDTLIMEPLEGVDATPPAAGTTPRPHPRRPRLRTRLRPRTRPQYLTSLPRPPSPQRRRIVRHLLPTR